MSIMQGIPGAIQTVLGGAQAGGEIFTQLLNMLRREGLAEDITRAGGQAADQFRTVSSSLLDQSQGRLSEIDRIGHSAYQDIKGMLENSQKESLERFGGIVPEIKGRIDDTLSKRDADIADLKKRLFGEDGTSGVVGEARQYVGTITDRVNDVLAGIRTNMTERAGETVGGLRMDAEQRARETEARLRQEGKLTEGEITREVNRIREAGSAAVSNVWGQAFTNMSEQIAAAGIAGNNTIASMMANANQIALGASQLFDSASAQRSELAGGLTSMLSGTMEFVADKTSSIIMEHASAQVQNRQARAEWQRGVQESLIMLDQTRIATEQYSIDTWLNSQYQAAGMRAGFMFQFPNLTGTMGSGLSMIQTAITSSNNSGGGGQKRGFSASVFGVGGGTSCLDTSCIVEVPGGYIPLHEVKIGMSVLGGDNKFHKVIGMDIGLVPLEDQTQYVQIHGVIHKPDNSGQIPWMLTLTPDHPVVVSGVPHTNTLQSIKAAEVSPGITILSPYGEAVVFGVNVVHYRIGGDLELEDCPYYIANGIVVESVLASYPEYAKKIIYDAMVSQGKLLAPCKD